MASLLLHFLHSREWFLMGNKKSWWLGWLHSHDITQKIFFSHSFLAQPAADHHCWKSLKITILTNWWPAFFNDELVFCITHDNMQTFFNFTTNDNMKPTSMLMPDIINAIKFSAANQLSAFPFVSSLVSTNIIQQ